MFLFYFRLLKQMVSLNKTCGSKIYNQLEQKHVTSLSPLYASPSPTIAYINNDDENLNIKCTI